MNEVISARPFWRQPLFHFLIAGAAIFALDSLRGEPENAQSTRIVVTSTHIQRLADQWRMAWGRAPEDEQLQALVRNYIKEEIYYREAIKLGLDINDPVIRQRLGQKMAFFIAPALTASDVTDTELQHYFQTNAERYTVSAVTSFEHIFFERDAEQADRALSALRRGESASSVGTTIGLPSSLSDADQAQITRTFGSEFYTNIQSLEPGEWSGPVTSGFGVHLVYISKRTNERPATLIDVRPRVLNDYLAAQNVVAQDKAFEQLRAGYDIEIEIRGE